jgi:hypothetical protein
VKEKGRKFLGDLITRCSLSIGESIAGDRKHRGTLLKPCHLPDPAFLYIVTGIGSLAGVTRLMAVGASLEPSGPVNRGCQVEN